MQQARLEIFTQLANFTFHSNKHYSNCTFKYKQCLLLTMSEQLHLLCIYDLNIMEVENRQADSTERKMRAFLTGNRKMPVLLAGNRNFTYLYKIFIFNLATRNFTYLYNILILLIFYWKQKCYVFL